MTKTRRMNSFPVIRVFYLHICTITVSYTLALGLVQKNLRRALGPKSNGSNDQKNASSLYLCKIKMDKDQ